MAPRLPILLCARLCLNVCISQVSAEPRMGRVLCTQSSRMCVTILPQALFHIPDYQVVQFESVSFHDATSTPSGFKMSDVVTASDQELSVSQVNAPYLSSPAMHYPTPGTARLHLASLAVPNDPPGRRSDDLNWTNDMTRQFPVGPKPINLLFSGSSTTKSNNTNGVPVPSGCVVWTLTVL
jgi:hypothetical protein